MLSKLLTGIFSNSDDSVDTSPKFSEVIRHRLCWNCQNRKDGNSSVRHYSGGEACYKCGKENEGGYKSDYREVEYMGERYFDPVGYNAKDYAEANNIECWSDDLLRKYDEEDLV